MRGIRGAVFVEGNTEQAIVKATQKLLRAIFRENNLEVEDVVAVFLTATPDLNAAFPAQVGRSLDLKYVPFLCAREMQVKGAPKKLIRALVIANTKKHQKHIRHQYLGEAKKLRPDLFQHISQERS